MKLKGLFAVIILMTFISMISAQPPCRESFSPYDFCRVDYRKSGYIFYGEVISIEPAGKKDPIESKYVQDKAVIKVLKTFKGAPPQQIEIYLNPSLSMCGQISLNAKYIFPVRQINDSGQAIYYSDIWSRSITGYSNEDLKIVFSGISAVLRDEKASSLQGYVFQKTKPKTALKTDQHLITVLGFDPNEYQTLPGILIEAKNMQNGEVYKTKTDVTGSYIFYNLPFEKYDVSAFLLKVNQENRISTGVTELGCTCASFFLNR